MNNLNAPTWKEAQSSWDELFYAKDPEAYYNFDDTVLFQSREDHDLFVLFFDGGCSCYGPFENENEKGDVYTREQLIKLVKNWKDTYGSEPVMKKWIEDNIENSNE